MSTTILVTGTSSGFGAMTVRALAGAGHTVHAGSTALSCRTFGTRATGCWPGPAPPAPTAAPRPTSPPCSSAKAAEDSLAVSYAAWLARFDIGTTIIVPGSLTTGTSHLARAGHPAGTDIAGAYDKLYPDLADQVSRRLAALARPAQTRPHPARAAPPPGTTWLLPRQPLVYLGEQFLPKLGITSRAALRDALATVSRPGRDDPSARAHGWLRRPR